MLADSQCRSAHVDHKSHTILSLVPRCSINEAFSLAHKETTWTYHSISTISVSALHQTDLGICMLYNSTEFRYMIRKIYRSLPLQLWLPVVNAYNLSVSAHYSICFDFLYHVKHSVMNLGEHSQLWSQKSSRYGMWTWMAHWRRTDWRAWRFAISISRLNGTESGHDSSAWISPAASGSCT